MSDSYRKYIRNFCIIAHIDHGKSTLADRLIEHTHVKEKREMTDQILDNMDIERERGITIKSQAVRLPYEASDGNIYLLNLIDTPGHVDFNYEVSRSLAACDGASLVVDSSQGVEAQTLANVYLAVDADLENDINIDEVLEKVVEYLPAPEGDENAPLTALVFDSKYDSYKGVIVSVRVKDGTVKTGDRIKMMHSGKEFTVTELGMFHPGELVPTETLKAGEVGYICASIKNVRDTAPGDTVTLADDPADEPLIGYKGIQQMVFCGMYPVDGARYGDLKDALEKLRLNDAALSFDAETSAALGFGFRCGFLGLLHYEVIQERLEREFNLDLISTAPSVIYKIHLLDGSVVDCSNPTNMPDPTYIDYMEEPIVKATIMLPKEYVGNIMELCQERRGEYTDMKYLDEKRVMLHYKMPLNEIIYDFFDALKSRTRGYASLDYEPAGYMRSKLVKLDILLNGDPVDALSFIVHADKAYGRGRRMCEKLKENIPRQQFEVPVQAAIGGKIIARETIKAYRKDVTSKCYGGDISRKKKLLEKQKEGKKRMRQVGSVEVPQEAFMSVLKLDDE